VVCDIFGGAQHGADDEIEFGHGMDPEKCGTRILPPKGVDKYG
jgi:hypothetical protein